MTKFTYLLLGAALSLAASTTLNTIQSSSSTPTGSAILTGNQYFIADAETTLNPAVYVNTDKIYSLTGSDTTNKAIQFDSSASQAACLKYGGRHTDCYQQKVFTTGTGACVAAGCTGAGKSYHVAELTKPYTGSGIIKRVEISCDGHAPSSTLYAAQVASSSTISGTNIFTLKTVGSGSVINYSTGSIVWRNDSPKIRVYLGKRNTQTECALAVWSDETYNP